MRKIIAALLLVSVGLVLFSGPIAEAVLQRPLAAIWVKVQDRWAVDYPSVFKPLGPIAQAYVTFFDDPVPGIRNAPALDTWSGRGASRTTTFRLPAYTQDGIPLARDREASGVRALSPLRAVRVDNPQTLLSAIEHAEPGTEILLSPGTYRLPGTGVPIDRAGNQRHPIIVRAERLGEVRIEFDAVNGFHVKAPFWVFENLAIVGVCSEHGRCEHAFHVVGDGRSVIIRNNRIYDFNAHIKVNATRSGDTVLYPDGGLLQSNTLYNATPRFTNRPVTPVNVIAASDWRIDGNLITDFAKRKGNLVSYGAYIKGNARGGIIERNLVVCAMNVLPGKAVQVGLSLGGGGTAHSSCRDRNCDQESRDGVIRNNIVMHCSNVGIDLNRARNATVAHNTVFASWGIDARFPGTTATVVANAYSGYIASRGGASLSESANVLIRGDGPYRAPRQGDFTLTADPGSLEVTGADVTVEDDFCGSPRTQGRQIAGALAYRDSAPGCTIFPSRGR